MNGNASRPIEDSVSLAIRDWQWRRILAIGEERPDMLVRIGKSAEKFMGDLIFENDTRFYLLEVKSNSEAINEEWLEFDLSDRAKKAEPKRKSKPKSAISTLEAELARLAGSSHDLAFGPAQQHIGSSLRCHLFAYWSDPAPVDPSVAQQVWIAPYLSTVRLRGGFVEREMLQDGLAILDKYSYSLDVSEHIEQVRQDVLASPISFSTLDVLNQKRLVITCAPGSNEKTELTWRLLGLPIEEFQSYVKFICRNKSISMNTIVMASNGASTDETFKTSELEKFVDDLARRIAHQPVLIDKDSMEELRRDATLATNPTPITSPSYKPRQGG